MFYATAERDRTKLPRDPFKAIVAPRPIGWISTRALDGRVNLAPYSFFNGFSSLPPIVGFSSEGWKDSASFAKESGEFVANLATLDLQPSAAQIERAARLATNSPLSLAKDAKPSSLSLEKPTNWRRARKAIEEAVGARLTRPSRARVDSHHRTRGDNRLERVTQAARCAFICRVVHQPYLTGTRHDLREPRTGAILDRRRRPADVNEAGDSLMFGKADRRAKALIVSRPLGEPCRREPKRAGGDDHVHAHGARRQDLLPPGILACGAARGDDGDNERRAGEAALLLGSHRLIQVQALSAWSSASRLARSRPSFERRETPGRELAGSGTLEATVGRGEISSGVGPGPVHHRRRDRSAAFQGARCLSFMASFP